MADDFPRSTTTTIVTAATAVLPEITTGSEIVARRPPAWISKPRHLPLLQPLQPPQNLWQPNLLASPHGSSRVHLQRYHIKATPNEKKLTIYVARALVEGSLLSPNSGDVR